MNIQYRLWYLFLLSLVRGLPDGFKQAVSCYGNTHTELIQPACLFGTVIAVRQMWATSKLKSTGCPQSILAGMTYDPGCCVIGLGDCKLPFDKTKRTPYIECTGKIECSVGTDWQQMVHVCGSLYLENSNIQSMDYNCISSTSIMNFNQVATQTQVVETYISNQGFPTKLTSSSGGTCYVTSCSSGIVVGLIDLRLTTNGGQCGQKLTIKDGGTTTDVNCDQNNDLTWTQIYTSVTSAVYITFSVNSETPDAFIWIDVAGSNIDAHCGVTESFTPSSDPVCITTAIADTNINPSGSVSSPATPEYGQPATSRQNGQAPTQNGIAIAALVVATIALIALIAVLIGMFVVYRYIRHKNNKTEPTENGVEENVRQVTSPSQIRTTETNDMNEGTFPNQTLVHNNSHIRTKLPPIGQSQT